MRYKLIVLSVAIVTISVSTFFIGPIDGSSASAIENLISGPLPTPVAKVKTKTIRELTFTDGEFNGKEIVKSDEQWKALMTPAEFYIMREEGTEAAYTGELTKNHTHGTYYCAACGLAVFLSDAKYESDTGWPSFFQAMSKKNVVEKIDKTLAEERTEVECARCHAHLGHVFDDGPQPTGLRYCMNSVALRFVKKP